MTRLFRRRLSALCGWLMDRRVPRPLRTPVYRLFSRLTGADPAQAQLSLDGYASFGAFFARRLAPGARPVDDVEKGELIAPCDGTLIALDPIRSGSLLQAKGHSYPVEELLAGAADAAELEGGWAWTIYLAPRDYHRVHAPLGAELTDVRWVPGDLFSVAPRVLRRRERVFVTNERAVMRLDDGEATCFLVMVGALNVGRIRIVGVEPGAKPGSAPIPRFERGAELARFEMGSTVILVFPPGRATPLEGLVPGTPLRMGRSMGVLHPTGGSPAGLEDAQHAGPLQPKG